LENSFKRTIIYTNNYTRTNIGHPNIFNEIDFSAKSSYDLELLLNKTLVQMGLFGEKARYKLIPNSFLAANYVQLAKVNIKIHLKYPNEELIKDPACVALHSSVDLAPSIRQYVKNWPGSVSFSLFASSYHFYFAVVYIKHLRKCYSSIKNQVNSLFIEPISLK